MKKILLIVLSAVIAFTGCSQYALQEDLDALKKEVESLKELCNQLNDDVKDLNDLMKAYQNRKEITDCVPQNWGWEIYFSDGDMITIRNGKNGTNGEDGKDGYAPVISIMQDENGVYCWALDGELIIVDGKTMPVTGEDGKDGENGENAPLPQFQIAGENMLQVSYDGGKTWSDVGKVEGVTTVPSAITDVKETDKDVTFTLAEGGTITMAKYVALKIRVTTPQKGAGTWTADYTLEGVKSDVKVACATNGDWKASVSATDETAGTITLTEPAVWEDASILVFAFSEEQMAMTAISIVGGVEGDIIQITQNKYEVNSDASTFDVPVAANFEPFISVTESWVTVEPAMTKALTDYKYTVKVAENTEGIERSASINFYVKEGGELQGTIKIVQSAGVVASVVNISADLAGSIYQESTVSKITITSDEALNIAGDKTLDATAGSVTMLPVSAFDVLFTLANGQAFHYAGTAEDTAVTLSGIDALIAAGKVTPEYVGLAGEDGNARANCYVVLDGGYYSIPAQLNDGTAVDAVAADWLWSEGETSLISGVSLVENNIHFAVAANSKGNAVVATKAEAGHISWSWHIWMLQEDPTAAHHYVSSGIDFAIMNYYLGATTTELTAEANGLYYQWGRKDPFPRANDLTPTSANETAPFADMTVAHVENTAVFGEVSFHNVPYLSPDEAGVSDIEYSVRNPMNFIQHTDDAASLNGNQQCRTWISTTSLEDAYKLWNNSQTTVENDALFAIKPTDKTNYDPCPAGYIVPSSKHAWHSSSEWKFANLSFPFPNTIHFIYKHSETGLETFYPTCGRRADGKVTGYGQNAYYWISSAKLNTSNHRFFGQAARAEGASYDAEGNVTAIANVGATGFSSSWAIPVRCVKMK
ncbi:MAG: PL29 family lyase N-terminal domain-containing protein [Candidatus Cryptobacteroides sp.]